MFKLEIYIDSDDAFSYKLPDGLVCTDDYGTYEILSESIETLVDFAIDTVLYMPWYFTSSREGLKEDILKKWNRMSLEFINIRINFLDEDLDDDDDLDDLRFLFNNISVWDNGHQSGYMSITEYMPKDKLNII